MLQLRLILPLNILLILLMADSFAEDIISPEIQSLINLANHGDAEAQFKVGSAYDSGNGAPRSGVEAMKWYLLAANSGNAEAQNSMGSILQAEDRYEESRGWYEKAAAQGHALAINNLAYLYDMGLGLPQDRQKGADLYLQAANLGWAEAMWNLSNMYGAGQLGQVDLYTACLWALRSIKYAEPNNQRLLKQLNGVRSYLERTLSQQDFGSCIVGSESWSPNASR